MYTEKGSANSVCCHKRFVAASTYIQARTRKEPVFYEYNIQKRSSATAERQSVSYARLFLGSLTDRALH